jgi:hypothetical protein
MSKCPRHIIYDGYGPDGKPGVEIKQ